MTGSDPSTLPARWERLAPEGAARPARGGAPWSELGADLLARYAEPHRHYHDRRHLAEVLDNVDLLAPHAVDSDTCRLAAWFHDAVYDPRRDDNEEASAALAIRELGPYEPYALSPGTVAEVARLVRLTATHDPGPTDRDGAVLCDADLAILGAAPGRYATYAADVRREYAHLDDVAFRRGRARVLRALRALDPLYRTPTGARAWTAAARANLDAELARSGPPRGPG